MGALFMGASRPNGRALIAPELTKWISTRLQEEAAILKERRKGREERQLARGPEAPPPPKGGKKQ